MTRAIQVLCSRGIRVVAFDMDQTAVAVHNRGRLERGQALQEYLQQATPDFLRLIPALHNHGEIGLSIATHSDQAEYNGDIQPDTHILGDELAHAIVKHHFDEAVANAFFIVAYNPRARGTTQDRQRCIKRHHMFEIQRHFGVQPSEIMFFDDTKQVVEDFNEFCGVLTVHVDPNKGFQLSDLLRLEQKVSN